jgi:hypothetical protein
VTVNVLEEEELDWAEGEHFFIAWLESTKRFFSEIGDQPG